MAGRPKNETTSDEEVKDDATVKENEATQKENEELRKQLEEMKTMMESLKKSQEDKEDSVDEIPSHKQIEVMSLVNGGLNLRGSQSQPHRFNRFGEPKKLSYDEVRTMYNNHPRSFQQGSIYIKDKAVVEALDLTEDYKTILDKKALDNFITLPADEITDFIKNVATRTQKETIVENAINGFASGDTRYMDLNKMKIIGDAVNKDVIKLATEKATEA